MIVAGAPDAVDVSNGGSSSTGSELIEHLGLAPHPEGGWYRRTWCAAAPPGTRPAGSAIYYLLRAGERSAPHRIDATEVWHHYAGAPLQLVLHGDGPAPAASARVLRLGPDILAGEAPQVVVPPGQWQSATTTGAWSLVGCTVVPAFSFDAFELDDGHAT
jgi:predicted cupin superfamily sugar epimerase